MLFLNTDRYCDLSNLIMGGAAGERRNWQAGLQYAAELKTRRHQSGLCVKEENIYSLFISRYIYINLSD